jgi:ATP-dependent RNA helicase DDX19/DBP5
MSSTEPTKEPVNEPVEEKTEDAPATEAQVDGSGEPNNGGPLTEVEYKVEVKLADMQADPNNPLYSAKSFDELNL